MLGNVRSESFTVHLADFCGKWQVEQLALFGSILRADFDADSDIDVLVTFAAGAKHTLFDLLRMKQELRDLFGRDVDLVDRRVLEQSDNYIRRKAILDSAKVIYGAGSRVSA